MAGGRFGGREHDLGRAAGAVGFVFSIQQANRQDAIEAKRAQQAQKLEDQRAQAEQEIQAERTEQATLQAYLDQMGTLPAYQPRSAVRVERWYVQGRDDKEVRGMPKTHYFPEDQIHHVWDNEQEPVLTVEPGDTVVYHTREVSDGQIGPDSTADVLSSLDWDSLYPLAGPVAMTDAEPGDILAVEVLDIHTAGWGWTAVLPGFGLLPEDFPDAYLKIFDLTNGDHTLFKDDIAVPIEPFFGTMGVSPSGPEKPVIMPPGPFGGNMDTRHITKGSVLYLPVQHTGALFSCGDAHAAQGDGEVCVTGIESPMYAALRFDLIKDRSIPAPQFQTPGPLTPLVDQAGWYATMGVNEDLMQAAKDSLRAMVEHISTTYGLEPVEAYVLASLVVDLKISEIVDQPNWIVSSYLPLAIFG